MTGKSGEPTMEVKNGGEASLVEETPTLGASSFRQAGSSFGQVDM